MWSKEENEQLRRNWEEATKVTYLAVRLLYNTGCVVCQLLTYKQLYLCRKTTKKRFTL